MTTPPSSNDSDRRVFFLSPFELTQVLQETDAVPSKEQSTYLVSTTFRVDETGGEQKCPDQEIPAGKVITYRSVFQKYQPLFATPRSITAQSVAQLRTALLPYARKKRGPSTPPHICVEVTADPTGHVKTITAWNPFRENKK